MPLRDRGVAPAGVRAIQPFGEDWLLVGHNDGRVDLVPWRDALTRPLADMKPLSHPAPAAPPSADEVAAGAAPRDESVRYITWIDQGWLLVSYRRAGARLIHVADTANPQSFAEGLRDSRPLAGERLAGIAQALRIGGVTRGPGSFLLADQLGQLWRWEWGGHAKDSPAPPCFLEGRWSGELPPALIEDVARVGLPWADPFRASSAKQAFRCLLVAADSGIYALDLRAKAWSDLKPPPPRRLALPGVGVAAMAITHVEFAGRAYLWLATRDGACHLFENDPLDQNGDFRDWVLGFQRSGQIQAPAQVLVAHGWVEDGAVWLAAASRDDQVRLYKYAPEPQNDNTQPDLLRVLTAPAGDHRLLEPSLRRAIEAARNEQKIPPADAPALDSMPPFALVAEAFELLTDSALFESLSAPETHLANAMLELTCAAGTRAASRPQLEQAIELWTLCLVGLVKVRQRPLEEWYLGILRFLRGLQPPRGAKLRALFDRAIDKAIRFATKWGLYGDVNQMRQDLVVPLQILKSGGGADLAARPGSVSGGELDALSYSMLLFRRWHSVVAEDALDWRDGTAGRALATLGVPQGTLVAVVWNRLGTYLGMLAAEAPDDSRPPELIRLQLRAGIELDERAAESQYTYGRSVLLLAAREVDGADWACATSDTFFLLTASREDRIPHTVETVQLWHLRLDKARKSCSLLESGDPPENTVRLDKESVAQSIYCMILLSPGLVAAGLMDQGGGAARVGIFHVSAAEPLRILYSFQLKTSTTLDPPGNLPRNRVFSLARVDSGDLSAADPNASTVTLLAGCENGEIWG